MIKKEVQIHPTAEVSNTAQIGENTKIWHQSQIREEAKIGKNCIFGKNVYIDKNVIIGNNVKIQNNVSVYDGVIIEDGVFVGPHVSFTNDKIPRAINPNGSLKLEQSDWKIDKTIVKKGSSIGCGSIILCGTTIGRFALVGAGSVVTKDIPDHALVYGNPARIRGYVCICGKKLQPPNSSESLGYCNDCKISVTK
ncbi:N-acetyltransferase [Candidatus Woesearchaeota archaeon]|nr:N-acetyltransferase [Candidatus Woesearchaeota archaeon]